MEISKDDTIFTIIDNISLNGDENIENIIKVENIDLWSEDNYYNFVNIMNSEGYVEESEPQTLHAYSNDYLLTIKSAKKILYYSQHNNYKYDAKLISWYNHNMVSKNVVNMLFNSTLTFLNIRNTKIDTETAPVSNWDNMRKYFKINKCITYTDTATNIKYIVNISKCHDRDYYEANEKDYHQALNKAKIINKTQKYEFYIDITNTDKDNIIPAIIKMEQALHLNSFIISKNQQAEVIKDYGALVKGDIYTRRYDDKKPPLLTPKPFTLERMNMLNPSDYEHGYGITSILSEYTVTEKADGERLLMYINSIGGVYLINNSHQVIDTGLKSPSELYNSLIDGEYIVCNKRKDNSSVGLYASFDIYYYNGNKITQLPLISNGSSKGDKGESRESRDSRYNYLLKTKQLLKGKSEFAIDYIVKEHLYSEDILGDCKNILTNAFAYPYEIDGLIFTPAKLAVFSNYANKPEPLTEKLGWDKVLKWKPPEQNSIDFLVKRVDNITIDTVNYAEFKLYVGYNVSQIENYTMKDVFNYIYKFKQFKDNIKEREKYICRLFKPEYYYEKGIDSSLVKIRANKEIRCDNGDKMDDETIVEFNYDSSEPIPSMRWKPMRVREDKTRIYRQGILSKTLNDFSVACNIWRSIHNPISQNNIIGNEVIVNNMDVAELSATDIYYSRTLQNDARLSHQMLVFHNHGVKEMLYSKPTRKGSIVELACGQGGDLNRWIKNDYRFVLGVDLVKNNIYSPNHGAYSRLLRERKRFFINMKNNPNVRFPDMVFAVGDCAKPIRTGECAINEDPAIDDKESYNVLKMVFSKGNKNNDTQFNRIIGKGLNGFDACSCMFGIHYFFKNEEMLDGFLLNVYQLLNDGGVFFCTFMDGEKIENDIESNGGDKIEGFKKLSMRKEDRGEPIWAIIRCYDKEETSKYNKKINVFIETTGKLIPEYVVSYKFLVDKCKDYGLYIKETEMFSDTFNRLKGNLEGIKDTNENLYKAINELETDVNKDLKRFSSFNRWCIFEKRDE
uniref:mRNA (guanine-N(7))-methyltransferase n=1 Tax=viral metagenome TaxID=1070528 RepID=A0A6C0L843_9ZZZZ